MFKNYFKTAWRNLKKRKVFTAINLLGLATGMAVCLLLALYIQNELGYDDFQEKGDQVYRLALERKYTGRSRFLGEIPQSIGRAVKLEFPEVLESVRIIGAGKSVHIGDKIFDDEKIIGVDSNFFNVFTGSFLQGDKNTSLQKPNTAVVNESTAIRFFGSTKNAMNKHILVNGFNDCVIDGVCKDWPVKSHFQFTILLSNTSFNLNAPDYYDLSTYTYLLLNKNASAKALEAKLPSVVTKYVAPTIEKGFGESFESFTREGNGYRYFLQPVLKIHLHSNLEDELSVNSSIGVVYLTAAIAAFILFLACINFINLYTAISVERAREIGIRKTFGSDKKSIVWQFLFESILLSLMSMGLGGLLAKLFLPVVNNITGSELSFSYFFTSLRIVFFAGFAIITGIIAGLYPAFVLSSFKPVNVLKGRYKSGARGVALRNGLVVFQFSISVILIICTIVITSQVQFILQDKLGFKKDNIIAINGLYQLQNRQAFIDEVSKITGVEDLSLCSNLPDGTSMPSCAMRVMDTKVSRTEWTAYVDDRYLGLLGLKLKEGRFFSKNYARDSLGLILNEEAVKDFGLKNPVGSRITSTEVFFNPPDGKSQTTYTVVGVIKDFNFASLHQKISPLVLANTNKFGAGTVAVKINGKDFKNTIASIEKTWKQFNLKNSFEYSFLDETIAGQYKAEETARKIFTVFSLLAILIACIGLFGLVMYSAFQRTKEIGIRKVLGASTASIIFILSKDFLRLIIISALIAFPVAWLAMNQWLQSFAYRINISWWMFLLAGLLMVLTALITVSFQSVKAAVANPVKSLRTE